MLRIDWITSSRWFCEWSLTVTQEVWIRLDLQKQIERRLDANACECTDRIGLDRTAAGSPSERHWDSGVCVRFIYKRKEGGREVGSRIGRGAIREMRDVRS